MSLAVAAALVAVVYLALQLNEEIRKHAEKLLAGHYADLRLEIGGARFLKGRGIKIYDLSIYEPRPDGQQLLLSVDETFLESPTDVKDMLRGRLRVDRVVVKRPALRVAKRSDGRWNVAALWPPPQFSDEPPAMVIEDASLVLIQAGGEHLTTSLHGIDLTLTPTDQPPAHAITPAANDPNAGRSPSNGPRMARSDSRAADSLGSRTFHVRASASGTQARHVQSEGWISLDDGGFDLNCEVRELEVSQELLTGLAAFGVGGVENIQLEGRANIYDLRVRRATGSDRLHWSSGFSFTHGRLSHPKLPRPVTELNLRGRCDANRCIVEQMTGKCGSADVVLACERTGWGPQAPLGLHAQVARLPLEEQLREVLPASLQKSWALFQPQGHVDADVQLAFDGQRWWFPQIDIKCLDVSFTHAKKFPYRLEQGVGSITAAQSAHTNTTELQFALTAMGAGRPIKLNAQFEFLASTPAATPASGAAATGPGPIIGWVEVSGNEVPIHEPLIAALQPDAQRIARSLHPQGEFQFVWRAEWSQPSQPQPDTSLEMTIARGAIQYEEFPYHLRNIRGRLVCRNNVWQIHDMQSRSPNRGTIVTVSGGWRPVGGGNRLQLTIQGDEVPLDGELRQAFRPPVQAIWNQLQPQGQVNFTARVENHCQRGQNNEPDIRITLTPHQQQVSLEPTFLPSPYRLEQLDGEFSYEQGQVTMKGVRARHGRVAIAAEGGWRPTPGSGWKLQFQNVHVDHLTASTDLVMALPDRLQRLVESVRPNGTFRLHDSAFDFSKSGVPNSALVSSWDVHLDCHQSDLQLGVNLEDVSGSVHLAGTSDGQRGYAAGELDLDSLVWNDVQLTAVRGPLWIDQTPAGSICYLGQHASQRQGQQPRDLSASAYGGSVVGNLHVRNEGVPQYQFNAAVAGVDLARFANERWYGRNELTGTVSGQLSVAGTGTSTDALTGRGELHVVDAHIYKLPVLVALLKVLQSRIPDTTAFNRCDSDFTILGQRIHFQQLNLLGDAVSFFGRGETNFDGKDLNLVFRTLVGRNELPVPVLSSLLGQASEQILQIRVDGTLENPETHAEALPAVGQVLQQIQEELQPVVEPAERAAQSSLPFWPFRR